MSRLNCLGEPSVRPDIAVIHPWSSVPFSLVASDLSSPRTKKADVAQHPKVLSHVGLLVNEPPGQGRIALYLVTQQRTLRGTDGHAAALPRLHALYGQDEGKQACSQKCRTSSKKGR